MGKNAKIDYFVRGSNPSIYCGYFSFHTFFPNGSIIPHLMWNPQHSLCKWIPVYPSSMLRMIGR